MQTFSKKKKKKSCDLRESNRGVGASVRASVNQSVLLRGRTSLTNVGIPRSSVPGMRDFNIIAGFVRAGTGFRVYARDAFWARTGFRLFFKGSRDTGCGTSHFSRDTGYGIRELAFCTGPRNNPESRTIPPENPRGRPWCFWPCNVLLLFFHHFIHIFYGLACFVVALAPGTLAFHLLYLDESRLRRTAVRFTFVCLASSGL